MTGTAERSTRLFVFDPNGAEVRCDSRRTEAVVENGLKLGGHASERGAAGIKASLDVLPAVDGNLAGLIKGFTTGKFLSMPRRRDETGVRGFNLRPQIFHGLDLLIRCHAVYGFHYGGHRKNLSAVILSKIVGGDKGIRAQRATTGKAD